MTPPPRLPAIGAAAPLNYLASYGPRADPVTGLTWFLLILSVVVTLIFTVAVVWGALARRQKPTPEDFSLSSVISGGSGLRWLYIGMPLTAAALVAALFWTMSALAAIDHPHIRPALTLEVTGRQWWWEVRYEGPPGRTFITANEIHIPVGEPVLVKLRGGDVIHSFWIPALTGKTDTIPGRNNVTWLQADKPGLYLGQCTEYCGLQHADMGVLVYAQPPAAFDAWVRAQAQPTAAPGTAEAAGGQTVFVSHCGKCHSIEGTAAHGEKGPDLTHLMSRTTIAAGVLINTVNNLSGWIADPQAQKPGAKMPATNLSGPQLQAVVAYLETRK